MIYVIDTTYAVDMMDTTIMVSAHDVYEVTMRFPEVDVVDFRVNSHSILLGIQYDIEI